MNDALFLNTIADRFEWAGSAGSVCTVSDSELYRALSARGVEFSERSMVPIDDFGVMGVQPGAGFTVDPVNVASGSLVEHEVDSVFAGAASVLTVERFYNTGDSVGGVFGRGFSSVLDERLEIGLLGATWRRWDGARLSFSVSTTGVVKDVPASRGPWWCSRLDADDVQEVFPSLDDAARVWVVSDNTGMRRVFDASGVLVGIDTGQGVVSLCRGEDGRVVRLAHSSKRFYDVFYNDAGFVGQIVDSASRCLTYTYDEACRLVGVETANGTRQYEWDDTVGAIARIVDEAGVVLCENTFNADKRVATQKTPEGRLVHFDYLPSGSTIVADVSNAENSGDDQVLGERRDVWVWDSQARVVGVVDSHGKKTSITRDRFGNPVRVTDREGRETRRVFDNRSRLVSQTTPEGVHTIMVWDEWDRCVNITREIPTLDGECIVEETILAYLDPQLTGGRVVRTPKSVTDSEGVTYTFDHDDAGRVRGLCGAGGYRLDFVYGETGDLTGLTNALDQTVSFTYDALGNIASFTSPSGAVTQFDWDDAGHMVGRVDPDGAAYRFVYENGHLVSQTAPDSGTTTYTYGANGKIVQVIDPLGRVTLFSHDDQGNTESITTPGGDTWHTLHDSMSRLTKLVSPSGDMWAYGYTPNGDIESFTSPNGLITSLTKTLFNGGTQISATTSTLSGHCEEGGTPDDAISSPHGDIPVPTADSSPAVPAGKGSQQSHSGSVVLDALGRPVTVFSPDGDRIETRVYDKAGRVREVLDAEGGLTRYEYNKLGLVARVVSSEEQTVFMYDTAGRLVKKTHTPIVSLAREGAAISSSSSVVFEQYEYDADGRITRVLNQDGEEQKFTYDVCGRVTSRIKTSLQEASDHSLSLRESDATEAISSSSTVSYSYDVCGRLASVTDGVHGTRSFSYDLAGQLVEARDANGNATTYTYTDNGRLESVTSPDGGLSRFEYDCYGNMTRKTDPLGRTETRTYDSTGNLTSLTRADNTGLSYSYDLSGRLLGIKNHKGQVLASYDYDMSARTVTIADSLVGEQHILVFDRLGHLVKKTTGKTTVAYSYDKTGKRESLTITSAGEKQPVHVSYKYGPTGKLQEITHSIFGTLTSSSSREGVDCSSSSRGAGNASDAAISYDENGRISRIVTPDSDVSYEYDAAGQLTVLTDNATGEIRTYTYDACGRLTAITTSEEQTRFTYNQAGELTSRTLPDGTVISYAYDGCGRRVSETRGGSLTRSFEWDNLGYLARITSSSSQTSEAGNEATPPSSQTSEAISSPTNTISLTHDIFGDLATLRTGEETTRFVWDTTSAIPSLLKAGSQDVFTVLGATAYGTPENNTGWMSHGWRGARPTNLLDPWALPPVIASSSLVVASEVKQSLSPWNILLGGSVAVSGIELMGARVYDPSTHSFLTTDPLPPVPGTPYAANPYEYAANNPLTLLDPHGLRALTD
ncbi:MAG: hypothetical protein IKZ87_06690, partial [Actinomycetaceae bacterium]|nr:hypothetical protein [Actinomycetaceae bacterium]